MPLGGSFAYPLGVPPTGLSSDQVLDLIVQLLPNGASKWMGIVNKKGDVYSFFAAVADSLKAFCYDGIAIVRSEISPMTAAYKLPEWEAALGLSQTSASLSGNTSARRTQIISRLREQGAFTIANIQAILGPLLGYVNPSQLVIYEVNRAALTTAHTYANNAGASIGGSSSVTQAVQALDDGTVSDAAVQLQVVLTCTNPEQLSFTLTGPTGSHGQAVITWPAGSLPPGAVTAGTFLLYDSQQVSVGKSIFAGIPPLSWTLQINTGAATCTLVSWQIFVEGLGRDGNGYDGLGSEMYYWSVYADPTLINSPQITAAKAAITRVQPAFSTPTLVQNASAQPTTVLFPPFIPRTT